MTADAFDGTGRIARVGWSLAVIESTALVFGALSRRLELSAVGALILGNPKGTIV